MVKFRVADYDEGIDVFTISAFGFTPEDQAEDPDYCRSAPDFDDFTVPGVLMPRLCAESGEPAELLNRVFTVEV
jgi:hypothetical protein